MTVHARGDAGTTQGPSAGPALVAFASIWAYAVAGGLAALGLTRVADAVTEPGRVRDLLQVIVLCAVALPAGLACESILASLGDRVAGRHDRRESAAQGPKLNQ